MDYCSNCGTKLQEDARFCDSCGSPVMRGNEPKVQQQNIVPEFINQQNAYQNYNVGYNINPAYNTGYKKTPAKQKLNYILFIYITSIIFLSYCGLRLFITLIIPGTWDRLLFGFYDSVNIIYTILVLAVSIIMLVQLVVAVNCFKKRSGPLEEVKNSAAKLSGLCLASFLLSLTLLIITIIFFVSMGSVLDTYWSDYILVSIWAKLGITVMFFIFDIIFMIFAAIGLSKSGRFREQIAELYTAEQGEEIE